MCPEYDQCIENTWLFPGNILYRPLVECPAVISVTTGGHQSCIWSNRHTHIYTHALCRQILTDSLSSHFVRLLEVRVRASMWYFVLTTSCFTLAAPPQGCRHNYNLPVMSASGDAGLDFAAGGRVILEGRLSVSHWASRQVNFSLHHQCVSGGRVCRDEARQQNNMMHKIRRVQFSLAVMTEQCNQHDVGVK